MRKSNCARRHAYCCSQIKYQAKQATRIHQLIMQITTVLYNQAIRKSIFRCIDSFISYKLARFLLGQTSIGLITRQPEPGRIKQTGRFFNAPFLKRQGHYEHGCEVILPCSDSRRYGIASGFFIKFQKPEIRCFPQFVC